MADDDPPPKVDRPNPDGVAQTVLDFLEAMKADVPGTRTIDSVDRKLFTYKVSLYFSIDDPRAPNAVRKVFAKWLNEISKFSDLQGANLRVTNCKDAFLKVPSLLYDKEFQELTGWETVKPGKTKNVYICVKVKSVSPFSRLKHRMNKFLTSTKIFMKRNHSLGDSSEEMATIGYLSPVHPDLLLDNIQSELNQEIEYINGTKDDDFLRQHGLSGDALGELVIAHGAVRGTSKQLGDVVNSQAVIVECPKNKATYYLQTVQEALGTFDWSPDMSKIKFVPFSLKANLKTKDIFTTMIVYNSMENEKKGVAQILGVSRSDMLDLRSQLITDGPNITHVEPTKLTDLQGRWRIYTSKDNLDTMSNWLTANLASQVESLGMRLPVPGFETPRLVASNQISSAHVQDIEAIALTVPHLDDVSAFPNLVIRSRPDKRRGAWTSSPNVAPTARTPSTLTPEAPVITPPASILPPARPPPQVPFNSASLPASSPILTSIAQRLEENSVHLQQLDDYRAADRVQYQAFQETLETLLVTITQDRESFRQELKETTVVLEAVTAGQSNIQQAMARRDKEHKEEADVMRASISQLTALVRDLVLTQPSTQLTTAPVRPRTDGARMPGSDPSESIGLDHKRSPDRTPCKRPPRVHKVSRMVEGMNTSDDALSLRQIP
jgi:hypothetical protein